MNKPLKIIVGAGLVACFSSAATGLASAAPDANGLANTKCSYDQLVRAVNAEVPGEASGINNSSQQAQGNFFLSDDIGAMIQVADSCSKY